MEGSERTYGESATVQFHNTRLAFGYGAARVRLGVL